MGGEKRGNMVGFFFVLGSPPRGRGKGCFPCLTVLHPGITPAWAGKSPRPFVHLSVSMDHPRVGGEKAPDPTGRNRMSGSPPRGRGKVTKQTKKMWYTRITPAWAGKRCMSLKPGLGDKDHPRVGGEKQKNTMEQKRLQGSPPRGRGKEVDGFGFSCRYGITPAWAGKRPSARQRHKGPGDHPRVGGEKTKKIP